MRRPLLTTLVAVTLFTLATTACGAGDTESDAPLVVASTSILGDVVSNLVGDAAEVRTVLPSGADPHDFQPSARDAAELREADLVVVNGAGLEEGMADVVATAEADGARVVEAIDLVDPLPAGGVDDDDGDDGREDEDDHGPGEVDPHFFTDPARMARAAAALVDELAAVLPDLDRGAAEAYVEALEALDAEMAEILDAVPEARRRLVTNHESLTYFAERFGFAIVGTVVPGGTTLGEPGGGELAELADVIEEAGVPAVFADTSSPTRLAEALAAEVGDVEVVELYTESLGGEGSPAADYLSMMRTDAERVAAALA